MKIAGLALMFLCLVSIRAANVGAGPAIEFTGVIVSDGKTKIAMTDKATGTTDWIEAGGNFKGYTVTAYDAKADAITVKKDGREEQLRLVSAKAPATTTATLTVAPPAPAAPTPTTAPASPNANLALPLPNAPNGDASAAATPPPPATVNVSVITPPPPASPEATNYQVKEGDTLTSVATATGVSIDQLKILNPGVNPTAVLKAGDPIRTR